MAITSQKWSQRVEAHSIWASLINSVKGKQPEKEKVKEVLHISKIKNNNVKNWELAKNHRGNLKSQNVPFAKILESK